MSAVVVCGMPSEKRALTAALPGVLVLSGTAKLDLPALVPASCTWLISMGLCGGLSPDIAVPDCVCAASVVGKTAERAAADGEFNMRCGVAFATAGGKLKPVPYYSSGLLNEANEVPQRASMFAKYGAHAIDDESRFVVAEAKRRAVPFNVLRSVSDAFDDNLPLLAVGNIMNADGSPNIPYLLSALGQNQDVDGNPSESVFTVAFHYGQSLQALEALARALAPIIME